jgi:hypothetical protein
MRWETRSSLIRNRQSKDQAGPDGRQKRLIRSVFWRCPSTLAGRAPLLTGGARPACPVQSAATFDPERQQMKAWMRIAAAAALGAFASVAAADITLYDRTKFRGRTFSALQSVPDLAHMGFNDRASSVVIKGGTWQLCTEAYFRGHCATLAAGDYPSLASMGLDDRVSSIRDMSWTGAGRSPALPGPANSARIVLYANPNLSGRSTTLDAAVANFSGIGFNDSARSAVVYGGNWQVCTDAQFEGDCEVLRPGQWNSLGGVAGKISSARPVSANTGPPINEWGSAARAILYESQGLTGRTLVIDRDVVSNLERSGFNDRARSLRVENGYWVFCSDARFEGECLTFGPGDYASLPRELDGHISSGRRISNAYPYSQPPRWQR